jgi:hypothetical protein
VVVEDVWFRDEPAGDEPVLATVSVFKPVKKAGQEVGHEHRTNYLENNHNFPTVDGLRSFPGFLMSRSRRDEASRACGRSVN